MGQRLTTQEWIAKARVVWGAIYDYTAVEYLNNHTPVEVRCPRHGAWFPLPANHIKSKHPRGCPACGRAKQIASAQKPFARFVAEASAVHGGRYSYDPGTYTGANKRMRILCPEHGEFWQRPNPHVKKLQGCPACAGARASSRSQIQYGPVVDAQIRDLSGGKVSLDLSTYKGINKKAELICSVHGRFTRLVNSALHSTPCLACSDPIDRTRAKRHLATNEKLLTEIARRWPKYKLQPFDYRGKNTRVSLCCPEHGSFEVAAASIRLSPGCPSCARKRSQESRTLGLRKKNVDTLQRRFSDWLQKAKVIHGDAYDYSRVEYLSARENVEIGCRRHGFFKQPPYTHLQAGCRKCADEDLKGLYSDRYFAKHPGEASQPASIYYLRLVVGEEVFYKVGITRTTLSKRFGMLSGSNVKMETLALRRTTLLDAFEAEQAILREHASQCRYIPQLGEHLSARDLRLGQSECFSRPLHMDSHLALVGLDTPNP